MDDERIAGYIHFSPATVEGGAVGVCLAPLAVLPGCQNRGIGTALTERGIAVLHERGCPFAIHLPDVPDDAFIVLLLDAGAMAGVRGVVRHLVEFDEAMVGAGDQPTSASQDQ